MPKSLQSLITASALALAIGVFVVEGVAGYLPPYVGPADATAVRVVEVPCAPQLVMETGDGSVRVTPRDRGSDGLCSVRADIRLYRTDGADSTVDLQALLPRVMIVESTSESLHLQSLPDDWPQGIAALVKYDVEVPEAAGVRVNGVNGNVWVAKGSGEVRIESSNADVAIYEPAGPVVARSTNGRLRLIGSREPATLETVNGNIDAEVIAGQLTAVSMNGNVRADIVRPTVAAAVLRSENGDVEIDLPRRSGFTLDAVADRGRVFGDEVVAGLATGSGAYRGVSGSGEMLLTLHSANGSIKLSRN